MALGKYAEDIDGRRIAAGARIYYENSPAGFGIARDLRPRAPQPLALTQVYSLPIDRPKRNEKFRKLIRAYVQDCMAEGVPLEAAIGWFNTACKRAREMKRLGLA